MMQNTLFDLDISQNESEEDIIAESMGVEAEVTEAEESILDPFDPTKIRVDIKPMIIDALLKRYTHHELVLNPGFQRKAGLWKREAQSQLIESLLIRIPIPAFYLDVTTTDDREDEKWVVVDGLQRITALKNFVVDKTLKLAGLDYLKHLHGKGFDELPRSLQRRIEETEITVYLIQPGTPEEVKFNIFKRINTGGLPLSAQEIRNALNQDGAAPEMLKSLAETEEFKRAVDYGIRDTRMDDRECVLRFLAFRLINPETDYRGELDRLLNEVMRRLNGKSHKEHDIYNILPQRDADRGHLSQEFIRTMTIAHRVFGKQAFRKPPGDKRQRYPVSKPLFEAWSVNLSRLNDEQVNLLEQRKDSLQDKFVALVSEPKFAAAISYATGDISRVRERFSAINRIIQETLR